MESSQDCCQPKRRGWDYGRTVNSELTTEPAPSVALPSLPERRGGDHGDIGDAAETRPELAPSVAVNSHLAKLIELLRSQPQSTKIKRNLQLLLEPEQPRILAGVAEDDPLEDLMGILQDKPYTRRKKSLLKLKISIL